MKKKKIASLLRVCLFGGKIGQIENFGKKIGKIIGACCLVGEKMNN